MSDKKSITGSEVHGVSISRIEICEKNGEYAIAFFHTNSPPYYLEGDDDYFGLKLSIKNGNGLIQEVKRRGLIDSEYSLEGANVTIIRI